LSYQNEKFFHDLAKTPSPLYSCFIAAIRSSFLTWQKKAFMV